MINSESVMAKLIFDGSLVVLSLFLAPAAYADPSSTCGAKQNLLTNGSFETGNFNGWSLAGSNPDGIQQAAIVTGYNGIVPQNGKYAALSLSYQGISLHQQVSDTPGQKYLLSFWINPMGGGGGLISFSQNDNDWDTIEFRRATGWLQLSFYFVASASGLDTLTINPVAGGFLLDNFSVVLVPPSKFAGTPGQASCFGQSVSALTTQYGGINTAANALGYGFSCASALQDDIHAYCGDKVRTP
jgi:hypothetical protein